MDALQPGKWNWAHPLLVEARNPEWQHVSVCGGQLQRHQRDRCQPQPQWLVPLRRQQRCQQRELKPLMAGHHL